MALAYENKRKKLRYNTHRLATIHNNQSYDGVYILKYEKYGVSFVFLFFLFVFSRFFSPMRLAGCFFFLLFMSKSPPTLE